MRTKHQTVQTYKHNLQHNNTNKDMESVPHNVLHKIINDSLIF